MSESHSKSPSSSVSAKAPVANISEAQLKESILRAAGYLRTVLGAQPVKIYELVQGVVDYLGGDFTWDADDLVSLYQKQFITQAALCELYFEFLSADSGTPRDLCCTPISVFLRDLSAAGNPVGENNAQALDESMPVYSPNVAFYMDYRHFFGVSSEDVAQLLQNFWKQLKRHDDVEPAYAELELSPSASWSEVQQQFRRLAAQHHPDRGGDAHRFIQLREAFNRIKQSTRA